MKQSEKWLIKYVHPPFGFAAISALAPILGAIIGWFKRDSLWYWVIGGTLIFVYMFFGDYLLPFIRLKMKLSQTKRQGDYLILLDDFRAGERVFGGSLILGECFIVAEDSGNIYRYDEINSICLVYHDSGAYAGHSSLFINEKNGKRRRLCIVYRQKYSRQDLDKVYAYLTMKNPNVKIGEA